MNAEGILMCPVVHFTVDCEEHVAVIHISKHHCTDMDGAIRLARMFDPKIGQVQVVANDVDDIIYTKRPGGWIAQRPASSR